MYKNNYKINFEQVNNFALANLEPILRTWLPDGKVVGCEYMARNPKRSDNKLGSFKINLNNGNWADFAIGKTGKGAISLCSYIFDMKTYDSAKSIHESLGL